MIDREKIEQLKEKRDTEDILADLLEEISDLQQRVSQLEGDTE